VSVPGPKVTGRQPYSNDAPAAMKLLAQALSILLVSSTLVPCLAQNAQLSGVSGMKPGDLLHLGISTQDAALDRCQIFYSCPPLDPWAPASKIALAPNQYAKFGPELFPQGCSAPVANHVAFAHALRLPTTLLAGLKIHFRARLWSSSQPLHRTITNDLVLTSLPAGAPLLRWGAKAGGTTLLYLYQWDVDSGRLANALAPSFASGLTGTLGLPPAVSPQESSAAIPVALSNGDTGIYVLQGLRSTDPAQITGHWLSGADPAAPSHKVQGTPQFYSENEVWVVTALGSSYRLARYELTATSPQFLGSSAMGPHPASGQPNITTDRWVIDAVQNLAIFLEQTGTIGVHLYRYNVLTGGTSSTLLNVAGYTAHHAGFTGILRVPSTSLAMVQYGTPADGVSTLRLFDVASNVVGGELTVGNPLAGASPGGLSFDGSLGLFRAVGSTNDAMPVLITPLIPGQPPATLPSITGFFCGVEATVASDGSAVVSGSDGCAHPVRCAQLGPSGMTVTTACGRSPLNQPFAFEGNPAAAAFRLPGRNAIYAQLGTVLQLLDVSTMTYSTSVISLGSSWANFYF
ncbi:MAG: hypothetical protein ABL998_16055, partial [Planctomycetota bacterium]